MAEQETHTKWWTALLNPQTFIYIMAGFASLVIFWVNQQNTTKDVALIKSEMQTKVTDKDFNALEARVSRQYEQFNKIIDRLNALEKESEYQHGLHDGIEQIKLTKK